VAAVVIVAKAPESLLVAVLIPLLVGMMLFIHRQYRASNEQLSVRDDVVLPVPRRDERAIVPVAGIDRAVVQAINVARSITDDVQAVLISDDDAEIERVKAQWQRQLPDVALVVVQSSYRALVGPMRAYLEVLDETWPADRRAPIDFVVIPEYQGRSWWERLLYNYAGNRLRASLLGRPHTVTVSVPYRRDQPNLRVLPPPA
jgi:hypothetical protein